MQGITGEFMSTHYGEAKGNLHVLIAAGPYSTSDNLSLEPLEDLIKVIKKTKPDACILVSSAGLLSAWNLKPMYSFGIL